MKPSESAVATRHARTTAGTWASLSIGLLVCALAWASASCTKTYVQTGATSSNLEAALVSPEEAVYSLAQKCFAIRSPKTGKFLLRFQANRLLNGRDGGMRYKFSADSLRSASHFFFKPTDLAGGYMLYDKGRYFVGNNGNGVISGKREAGENVEWQINAQPDGRRYKFRFLGKAVSKDILHLRAGQQIRTRPFFGSPLEENYFRLEAQSDCSTPPEAELNLEAPRGALKGNVKNPVRGYVDPHTHITSYEFMGGKWLFGSPVHRFGITHALGDSITIHGLKGFADFLGNIMGYDEPVRTYDTKGWPTFKDWPAHKNLSHTGYYYKWIERAHKSGLRMMVSHLVENRVLCRIQRDIVNKLVPAGWTGGNSCYTMDSVKLQRRRLAEIEAYIDAQAGGPGKGFLRIVTSASEARQVIADGKLAVVIGVEVSELFNCRLTNGPCNEAGIDRRLQELYDMGVRTLFPVHRFDNQFGGTRIETGFINVGQQLSAGYFFQAELCDNDTQGAYFENGFPIIGNAPIIKNILTKNNLNPQYDTKNRLCNKNGLTKLGAYLVNRMIDMNMIIELDHMSASTVASILDIVEARGYSGVVSGHSHMHMARDEGVHKNGIRVAKAGGILAPYNKPATFDEESPACKKSKRKYNEPHCSVKKGIDRYLKVVEQTPYVRGVPFSTDMSGLGAQAAPRPDVARNPLTYPFTSEFGVKFDRQRTGERVFDLNKDGVAHYGLLPDHVEDIRRQAGKRIYESVMNSAEAYLQMWERVERHEQEGHHDPFK